MKYPSDEQLIRTHRKIKIYQLKRYDISLLPINFFSSFSAKGGSSYTKEEEYTEKAEEEEKGEEDGIQKS